MIFLFILCDLHVPSVLILSDRSFLALICNLLSDKTISNPIISNICQIDPKTLNLKRKKKLFPPKLSNCTISLQIRYSLCTLSFLNYLLQGTYFDGSNFNDFGSVQYMNNKKIDSCLWFRWLREGLK